MRWRMLRALGAREVRAAVQARWFWIYSLILCALAGGLLWMAASQMPTGLSPEAVAGRVVMAAVNLLALLIPLMGLSAGAQSLARERDHRSLSYLLAQPVTRSEVLLGKLAGNAMALGAAIAGAVLVLVAGSFALDFPIQATEVALVGLLAWLLSLASLSLGAALAAGAGGLATAQGSTLGSWLLLIVLGDLGLIGLLLLRQVPVQAQLVLTFLNPVHQFRVAAVSLVRPSLEVLGPAGLYAQARLGDSLIPALLAALAIWTLGILLVALERFRTSRVLT